MSPEERSAMLGSIEGIRGQLSAMVQVFADHYGKVVAERDALAQVVHSIASCVITEKSPSSSTLEIELTQQLWNRIQSLDSAKSTGIKPRFHGGEST